jgi:integrase
MSKITKRFVESITADPEKILIFWDSELKGFGVVILPSQRRTYVVQYRNTDRIKKRLKLGVHGQITAEQARELARLKLAEVTQGKDPAEEKRKIQDLATVKDLAKDYLERHAQKKRPKSVYEDEKLLEKIILPALGKAKIIHVSRRDVETLHLQHEKTPYQANRALALLSKMFSLAMAWEWCDNNPTKGIQKYSEEKRDRWLDDKEMEKLWQVLDEYPNHPTAYVFKFLLLTGARKGEVLNATWDQFDLEKGIWTKPSHLTKQKKTEYLPLSGEALEVLSEIQKFSSPGSPYLFSGRVPGEPLKEVKTFWKSVLKKASLNNIRIHDLRHTHASHLVSSGLSLSIVGRLLGHTQAATTQRYAHLADQSLRQATELFGKKIAKKRKESYAS